MISSCHASRRFVAVCHVLVAMALLTPACVAQKSDTPSQRIEHELIRDATVYREATRLRVEPDTPTASGSVTIPRMFASLRSARWQSAEGGDVTVHPEPDHWVLSWTTKPAVATWIEVEFDQVPLLASEVDAVTPTGDGSLMLPACHATTSGEKLRYEPQPHKNTVGYWVNQNDFATWTIQIPEPGEFNLGILQGCGAGQGGSVAAISLMNHDETVSTVDFEVLETGHFQNFQWRTVGQLAIEEPGVYSLRVAPKQIAKNALMDVRAIHLVRLPAKKK